MSFAADDASRAAAQLQASAILTRIEQQKNRGEDYKLSDIALLRKTCQAGGGVTVDTRTVGGRDAIYRAAFDAAVRRLVFVFGLVRTIGTWMCFYRGCCERDAKVLKSDVI